MTDHNNINETWEARINDLLDGELGEDEVAELKREAETNAALAQAIIDAHALQARLDDLQIERAPESLRTRLAEIPDTERPLPEPRKAGSWFGLPRWIPAGALAAIPVLVIAMTMMRSQPQGPEYTEAEILKAQQEVAIAFAYLDRIGQRAGQQIESELAKELSSGITENVSRYMPYTNHTEQEESS
ncbi:MAG TPA: hypothetical protein VJ984_04345 [Xanthomonadales bacterium]|nr:hypothetical protein [Xanthomonadales bacterium]